MRLRLPALGLLIIVLSACEAPQSVEPAPRGVGIGTAYMDTTVRPQDDMFRYANGAWLESATIPEDKPYTASFVELRDTAETRLRSIIEFAATAEYRPEGSDEQKVGDLYLSYLDSVEVERLGLSPLEPEFAQIDRIGSVDDLLRFIGQEERASILDPISIIVNQDFRHPDQYMLYMAQSGLALPDRDYYLEDRFEDVRTKYVAHIQRMHELAGIADAKSRADRIYALEKRLATSHWSAARVRDRDATYNKYSLADARQLMPNFNWDVYLEAIGVGNRDSLVIRQPDYFQALDRALADVPLDDWKAYMTFRVLSAAAPRLPEAFVKENFDFFGKTLNGQPANRLRWKRAVSATDGALGEAVGRMYVKKYFPEESKVRMEEMIANLSKAFGTSIDQLDWMTDSTKAEAQKKLSKFRAKIGYPDKWKDYSELEIRPGDLYGNLRRAAVFSHMYDMGKLGKPVDRDEWLTTPQTVNAFYNPAMNDISFPAAILEAPFFDSQADDAFNYGAIGSAIGHEFSHGFDDQGRKSDGDGTLRDWWTEKDAEEYKKRANGLVAQYDAYSPVEGFNVNGELTLGENIGDLAGLTMAYRAYQLSLHGNEAPVIDGFSGDERFFIGFCQVWRSRFRDEFLKRILVSDPHSPSEYRCNGTLENMPEFHKAFSTAEGDSMYKAPEDRIKIW